MTSSPPDADDGAPRAVVAPLTVAAVAARLGVAPATLRTWDRRYGLGPSERTAGSHRRYTGADVERLLVMRRLTLDGVAPGDAARLALQDGVTPSSGALGVDVAPIDSVLIDSVPVDSVPVGAAGVGPRSRAAAATPAALVDAALLGDPGRCAQLVALAPRAGLAELELWWAGLVEPALVDLARRTVVDRPGQDSSLLVRSSATLALARWLPPAPGGAVVLILVPPGHERPLVAHALAAALVAGGVDARIVGGPTGRRHALELVVMTRPEAVVTVSGRPDADLEIVAHLAQAHPDLAQFVMLPDGAWALPAGVAVQRSRSFRGLLHEVLAVAGPRPFG